MEQRPRALNEVVSVIQASEGRRGNDRRFGSEPAPASRLTSLAFPFKALRFCLVGGANGLIFAVSTDLYIRELGMSPTLASVAGYLTAIPFAFVAHRWFTFRSDGPPAIELPRFVLVNLLGLVVSAASMYVVSDRLGFDHRIGAATAILLVPVMSLLIMDRWVFSNKARG